MSNRLVTDPIRERILAHIKDQADLPKFEKFFRLMDKRLSKQRSAKAGPIDTIDVTMACWKRVFGVDWPKTRATRIPMVH